MNGSLENAPLATQDCRVAAQIVVAGALEILECNPRLSSVYRLGDDWRGKCLLRCLELRRVEPLDVFRDCPMRPIHRIWGDLPEQIKN